MKALLHYIWWQCLTGLVLVLCLQEPISERNLPWWRRRVGLTSTRTMRQAAHTSLLRGRKRSISLTTLNLVVQEMIWRLPCAFGAFGAAWLKFEIGAEPVSAFCVQGCDRERHIRGGYSCQGGWSCRVVSLCLIDGQIDHGRNPDGICVKVGCLAKVFLVPSELMCWHVVGMFVGS